MDLEHIAFHNVYPLKKWMQLNLLKLKQLQTLHKSQDFFSLLSEGHPPWCFICECFKIVLLLRYQSLQERNAGFCSCLICISQHEVFTGPIERI